MAAWEQQLTEVSVSGLEAVRGPFDLVINGTAASLGGEVPAIAPDAIAAAFCYDMMYGAGDTPFIAWARRHGAAGLADGLGMLVEQAAESFFIWRGKRPLTAPVIATVQRSLSG